MWGRGIAYLESSSFTMDFFQRYLFELERPSAVILPSVPGSGPKKGRKKIPKICKYQAEASVQKLINRVSEVCSDGYIYMEYYCRVIFPAFFDIRQFPFDKHSINMWFRHPTGGIQEINPHSVIDSLLDIQFQLDVENIEWKLLNYSCRKKVFGSNNEFKPQIYAFIICTLGIQRRAGFYCINYCVPSLAVTVLCILATHSGASVVGARTSKYQFGMMALMSFGVYSVSLTQGIPRSSVVSRLHLFFMCESSIIFSACFVSWFNVVIERNYKKKAHVKVWLRYVDLASFVCHWFMVLCLCFWFFSGA